MPLVSWRTAWDDSDRRLISETLVEGSEGCHGAEAGGIEGAEAVNRRGNGLSADTYALLIDLAAELVDTMLTALREAGIAAYVSSSATQTGGEPGTEERLDRLYVDTSMKSIAEGVLRAHLERLREEPAHGSGPGTRPMDASAGPDREAGKSAADRDDEAIWAEIVASFESSPQDSATPWPDEENLDETSGDGDRDDSGQSPTDRMTKPVGLSPGASPKDDDHYIPPPPPPLPSGDPVTRSAWAALLGGPLYLLFTVLLGWEVPGWAAFLAVAAFIGGFVTLVLRMGDDPRGPDDGAVV